MAWCGVFLLCGAVSGCSSGRADENLQSTLTIGIAEGSLESPGGPAAQLSRAFTLEGLVRLDADGRHSPNLAESWEWEDAGQTLLLNIREGVSFHDGTPLDATTATDALSEALGDPETVSNYWALRDIDAVRAEAPYRVAVTLSAPSTFVLDALEVPLGRNSGTIGTGPYKLVDPTSSATGGPVVELVRFEDYHKGTPAIARVVIRPFESLRIVWTRLLRRDIDMVTNVAPDAVEFVSNQDIDIQHYPRRYQYLIAFNSRRPPFTMPAVRRALNIAIDRERIVSTVFKGRGSPATGPLWPMHWAYDGSVTTPRDQDQARQLLTQSVQQGTAGRNRLTPPDVLFSFTCLIPEGRSVEHLALEVRQQLLEIGVDVQFELVPGNQFAGRLQAGQFDAVLLDMVSGPTIGRPFMFWGSSKTSDPNYNFFGYENEDAERQFQILRSSFNEVAIRTAMRRLQRVFAEDPPALFLVWNERAQAVSASFETVIEPGQEPLSDVWRWKPRQPNAASVSE